MILNACLKIGLIRGVHVAATSARLVEIAGDSSDDSDMDNWTHLNITPGNLDVVRRTLDGIAAESVDEGEKGLGRYAETIRLGKHLWQSRTLTPSEEEQIEEKFYDEGFFPATAETKKALLAMKKIDEKRPEPFQGRTQPFAHLSVNEYDARMIQWFNGSAKE